MTGTFPELDWKDDVPMARAFEDPYYSCADGLAETRHVFLGGNDLPARFRPGFHIAELGFGTGLNALAALASWRKAGCEGPLKFTSFEAFPMRAADALRALSAFPEVLEIADPALVALGDTGVVKIDDLHLTVIIGDARKTLPDWDGMADAWFLDGFAPARNPELWEPDLLCEVARHTKPSGTVATYSAAGVVRQGLSDAGFQVARVPGFGRKRHMVRGALA